MPQVPHEHPVRVTRDKRQSRRKQGYVHQDPPLRVERIKGPEIQRQNLENCVRNSTDTRVWKGDKELSANLQSGLEEGGKMELTKRLTARRSWISERKSFKSSCERLRGSRKNRKAHRRFSKKSGSKNCSILSRRGMISCQSIKKAAEEVSNIAKVAGQREAVPKRRWQLCRGNGAGQK